MHADLYVLFTAVDGGPPGGDLDLACLLVLPLSRLGGGNLLLAALLVPLQGELPQHRRLLITIVL
jgi:hypothetical protein